MDVLFVIDDSPSMGKEQQNLRENLPRFTERMQALRTLEGEPLSFHYGVISASVTKTLRDPSTGTLSHLKGDDGELQNLHCYGNEANWRSTDSDSVRCLANVGLNGSQAEMPLEAIRLATEVSDSASSNSGFIRPEALLAVVVLSDEDDCSYRAPFADLDSGQPMCRLSDPVMPYLRHLDSIKGDRGRWSAHLVTGGEGCESTSGSAEPSHRLNVFANAAGDGVSASSICDNNFSEALSQALATFADSCRSAVFVD